MYRFTHVNVIAQVFANNQMGQVSKCDHTGYIV